MLATNIGIDLGTTSVKIFMQGKGIVLTEPSAVAYNQENKIVGIGYNGMPIGCDDSEMPWGRSSDFPLNTKYPFVVHSELNAILNSMDWLITP